MSLKRLLKNSLTLKMRLLSKNLKMEIFTLRIQNYLQELQVERKKFSTKPTSSLQKPSNSNLKIAISIQNLATKCVS